MLKLLLLDKLLNALLLDNLLYTCSTLTGMNHQKKSTQRVRQVDRLIF